MANKQYTIKSEQSHGHIYMKQYGVYLTLPFVLAIPPVIGWLIGSFIDELLHTRPYFMYAFILLGFIAGFREFYRIVKRFGE